MKIPQGLLAPSKLVEAGSPIVEKVSDFIAKDELLLIEEVKSMADYEKLFFSPNSHGTIGWLEGCQSGIDMLMAKEWDIALSITEVKDFSWKAEFLEELEEYTHLGAKRRAKLLAGEPMTDREQAFWQIRNDELALDSLFVDVNWFSFERRIFELSVFKQNGQQADSYVRVGPIGSIDLVGRLLGYFASQWYGWTDEFSSATSKEDDFARTVYRYLPSEKKMAF